MAVNGVANGYADANGVRSDNDIVLGLMNYQGKYLTAEKFGNQISVTGSSLRAKQMWTFVQETEGGSKGYLRSPKNNYLETNKHGDVTCESDEKDSAFIFDVVISDDGKWAFRDIFGKYLAGNSERLYTTMEQKINNESLWAIHLATHPQVNMKNVARKCYAHLEDDELRANEDIPWGHDAVITLEFQKGLYAIRTSTGSYLNGVTGGTVDVCDKDCLFVLSIREHYFAFRASNGKYLTIYGPKSKLIATKPSVGRDELFSLEKSKAQCVLVASNEKKVSIKQGIDLTANQFLDAEDTETFQLGYHPEDRNKVTFQSRNGKYWQVDGKGIRVDAAKVSPNCFFGMEWVDNKIALKFGEKYITSTSGGQLQPVGDSPNEANARYVFELVNRHILVLRGDHGYMGIPSTGNKIACNRGFHDAMQVTYVDGYYRLKVANGKSWVIDNDKSLAMGSGEGDLFIFELYDQSKMRIRVKSGGYLEGDHNGAIKATGDKDKSNTIWEY